MGKKKSGANSAAIPMIGRKVGGNVSQPVKQLKSLTGTKVSGKVKASKSGGKLNTPAGRSSISNPPTGGGY